MNTNKYIVWFKTNIPPDLVEADHSQDAAKTALGDFRYHYGDVDLWKIDKVVKTVKNWDSCTEQERAQAVVYRAKARGRHNF